MGHTRAPLTPSPPRASVRLAAQSRTPAQLEPFRTEVNYIRVDMYPTADGKPVTDLRQEEIELFDEDAPQTIDRFEHVLIRGARSQETRREPATVAEMREASQDVRARLFVLFLDTEHVEFGPAYNIKSPAHPVAQSADRRRRSRRGDDGRHAGARHHVQTPHDVDRRDVERLLERARSPQEQKPRRRRICDVFWKRRVADEMIFRRREVRTLDALEALVQHLRYVREERKAVIAISQGWRLYGEDPTLRATSKAAPPVPTVGIDSRTGRLGTIDRSDFPGTVDERKCEQERISLSMLRNEQRFHGILNQANAANTSFYPVDPRGLVVFDEPIVPLSPSGGRAGRTLDLVEDSARLNARNNSLRTMAEATDGLAVVQNGDLAAGMRRIVEDLSSYLSARLLLHSRARREVPSHQGACETSWRECARAHRISRRHSR